MASAFWLLLSLQGKRHTHTHFTTIVTSDSYISGWGTHSVLWVENVRGRRIVNNDDVVEVPSQPTEVFDVVPSMKNAGFSKESCSEHTPLVQQVRHWVCILHKSNTETCYAATRINIRHILHFYSCTNTRNAWFMRRTDVCLKTNLHLLYYYGNRKQSRTFVLSWVYQAGTIHQLILL